MPFRPPSHKPPGLVKRRAERAEREAQRQQSKNKFYCLTAWRRLRKQHLAAHPLCVFCLEKGVISAATDVDHIVPISLRPDLALDPSNLRSLDHACHSSRTAREQTWKQPPK